MKNEPKKQRKSNFWLNINNIVLLLVISTFFLNGCGKKGCTDPRAVNYDPNATTGNPAYQCEYDYSEDNPLTQTEWHFIKYVFIDEDGFPIDSTFVNDTVLFFNEEEYYYINNNDTVTNNYIIYRLWGASVNYYYFGLKSFVHLGDIRTKELHVEFDDKIEEIFTLWQDDNNKKYKLTFDKIN